MMKIIIFICLIMNKAALGSTLFLPDSDTAALVALVSNTASTVTNTMKILEVAKTTSEQIDKYNFVAMRRYFMARRIEQHVRDIIEAKKMNPKGLQEINQVLLTLKLNLRGLKSNIDFLAKDVFESQDFIDRHWDKVSNSLIDERESRQQEIQSANEGSLSKHVQNTAMNTALSNTIASKMRRDNLDYQKVDLALKKSDSLEKLRREEHYRKWIGLSDEEILAQDSNL